MATSETIHMRNSKLMNLGQMILDGELAYKLDLIAKIKINDQPYFNVFRRYNSPYNILVEHEQTGDIYYGMNYTMRQSILDIFCLSLYFPTEAMTATSAISYKHSAGIKDLCKSDNDILDMSWTEIQSEFEAIQVNIILDWELKHAYNYTQHEIKTETTTPSKQTIPEVVPAAPVKPTRDEREVAVGLMRLSIPDYDSDYQSESDRPTLSMRFADIQNRKREYNQCYCNMEEDSSSEEEYEGDFPESDSESDSEDNYIVLRNGRKYRKVATY